MRKTEITFLSNYSWNAPNVLELLCETASFLDDEIRYFSKPVSIFKNKEKNNSPLTNIECNKLYNISVKFSKIPLIRLLQDYIIEKQIFKINPKIKKRILFFNNLDSLKNQSEKMKEYFDKLVFLCEDYSEINDRLISNCKIADCILVIPKTMLSILKKVYPEKRIVLWPQPTSCQNIEILKQENKNLLDKLLENIPEPRIIYSGYGLNRLNREVYMKCASHFKNYSFLSFGDKTTDSRNNMYIIPPVSKPEMLYIISKCQIGFMPYDISDPHNKHCVPLKLFDYFSIGIPVVSSKLININHMNDIIYLCGTCEEFICAIDSSLKESRVSSNRQRRKQIYKYHNTKERSNDLKLLIDQLLDSH